MRPFWLEHALSIDGELAPALQGAQQADVAIVGGGFTGLWTALQLKQQNPALDIAIIESDICGAGASGRNGGCLLTWTTKFFTLRRLFGESEAVRLAQASEQAVMHIAEFCRQHRIDAEFRQDGTLYTATTKAQMGVLDPCCKSWTSMASTPIAACRPQKCNDAQARCAIWPAYSRRRPPPCIPANWYAVCAA